MTQDTRTIFLDTNVFMGYALDGRIEKFHPQCCTIFSAPNLRYTSLTVKQELGTKQRDRKKLYREIVAHIASKKPSKDFHPSSGKRSDIQHGITILEAYDSNLMDLEFIRTLFVTLSQGIMDALLSKTHRDLVARSDDGDMKDHFQFVVGIHHPDDSILADFFDWALPKSDVCSFVTCDGTVDQKKVDILDYVKDYKQDCNHLSIWFVTSAAKRVGPPDEQEIAG